MTQLDLWLQSVKSVSGSKKKRTQTKVTARGIMSQKIG